jgi:hypothetical protein
LVLPTNYKEEATCAPSLKVPPLSGGLDIIRAFSVIVRYFLLPLFFFVMVSPGLVFAYFGHTVPPQYIILSIELLKQD